MGFAGTGTRVPFPGEVGVAGRGPGGHLGALGLEVNLFKLGGYGYTGLGADPTTDSDPWGIDAHGLAARRAAEAARRSERINRTLDQQDAARRAAERERAIKLTQEAFDSAALTQGVIIETGSESLKRVMRGTTVVGIIALGAFAVTAIFSNMGKKRRDIEDWEHQKKYRSYKRPRSRRSRSKSRTTRPKSQSKAAPQTLFSPSFGGAE